MDSNFKLKAGLQSLGCSAVSFAALATPPLANRKISQQLVSQIISGTKAFDSPADAQQFLDVVESMKLLQQTVQPRVPIDWSNVLELRDSLVLIHEQRKNDMDPILSKCVLIRLSRTNFFRRLNQGNVVSTPSELIGAAFEFPEMAQKCVRELKKLGTNAHVETCGAFRRRSTMANTLQELGFELEEVAEVPAVQ